MTDTKQCIRCDQHLPSDDFGRDRRMASGLKSYCRACCREDSRERYHRDTDRARETSRRAEARRRTPDHTRERHLKARYGLTRSEYDALLSSQNGRCAICRTEAPGGKGDWHVDHDHTTGHVRGLLCAGCNVGIAQLGDDPNRLRAAADYVASSREVTR